MIIDLSESIENLVDMADYLLALKGKKAACNTYDSVENLSDEELESFHNIFSELEINLEGALYNLISTLLTFHGFENDEENKIYYDELYKLILEKGKFGYSELLKICNMEHLEFCIIKK